MAAGLHEKMDIPPKIIDAHVHLWGKTFEADRAVLVEMADRFDLEAMWVSPLFGGLQPSVEDVIAGNDVTAAFARDDPRVRPFARIEPRHGPAARDELNRCMDELGFAAVKVWIFPADDPAMDPLVERLVELGRPLLMHALDKAVGQFPGESRPAQVASLGRRHPEATIIMAHIGGDFIAGCDAIADVPNIRTDPSGSYCERGMLERAVETLGADRILFGTDAPGASFVINLAKVLAAEISETDKDKILRTNARGLSS